MSWKGDDDFVSVSTNRLRVLEYYRGILFLTSNRETVIDDAIMSRATAWVRYEKPSPDDLGDIWKILSEQFKVPLNAGQILRLVTDIPGISGRNVKNLLKLARLLALEKKKPVDVELLKYVSRFLDLEERKPDEARQARPVVRVRKRDVSAEE